MCLYEKRSLNRWDTFITFKSNIITIKRKSTTIAPTYTIKNKIAKYSTLRIKRSKEPPINTEIKTNIEWIGFWRPITNVHPPKMVATRNERKKLWNVIVFFLFLTRERLELSTYGLWFRCSNHWTTSFRKRWDSNPWYPCEYFGLANRRLKPLDHLSPK